MDGRKRRGRKLLIATLGVAAVSYVGCGSDKHNPPSSGNLMPPPDSGMDAGDGSPLDVVANLVAPPDSAMGGRGPRDGSFRDVVANLITPDLGTE